MLPAHAQRRGFITDAPAAFAVCVTWRLEGSPSLPCLRGQGSFLLNNASPVRLMEKSLCPRAQLTLRQDISLCQLCRAGTYLVCSSAQVLFSATTTVLPRSCWGWALLCYPLDIILFLLYFASDPGSRCWLLSLLLLPVPLYLQGPKLQLGPPQPTALTAKDGTEHAKNRTSITGRDIYIVYHS